jgi:hypothetical protein
MHLLDIASHSFTIYLRNWNIEHLCWTQSHSKCLADVCGALHCDLVLDSAPQKTKCNPAATGRNKHLCEVASQLYLCFIDLICLYLTNMIIVSRVSLIVVSQSMRVLQLSVSMVIFHVLCNCEVTTCSVAWLSYDISSWHFFNWQSSSCANFAMPTLALEVGSHFLKGGR